VPHFRSAIAFKVGLRGRCNGSRLPHVQIRTSFRDHTLRQRRRTIGVSFSRQLL
jgi:hypothetical protein